MGNPSNDNTPATAKHFAKSSEAHANDNALPPLDPYQLSQHLTYILDEPELVVERRIEMANLIWGWEQSRFFRLTRPDGLNFGHLEERDSSWINRQVLRLRRPYNVRFYDVQGNILMSIERKFSLVNSFVSCTTPDGKQIGQSTEEYHVYRRRYNLHLNQDGKLVKFGRINAPPLTYNFAVEDENGHLMGAIERKWTGIGRQAFTDKNKYLLHTTPDQVKKLFPKKKISEKRLSWPERTIMLAALISIDFDHFSKHS